MKERRQAERRRGPGRPSSDTPGECVCTWLPADAHDWLIALAKQREDKSVSAALRDIVQAARAISLLEKSPTRVAR